MVHNELQYCNNFSGPVFNDIRDDTTNSISTIGNVASTVNVGDWSVVDQVSPSISAQVFTTSEDTTSSAISNIILYEMISRTRELNTNDTMWYFSGTSSNVIENGTTNSILTLGNVDTVVSDTVNDVMNNVTSSTAPLFSTSFYYLQHG